MFERNKNKQTAVTAEQQGSRPDTPPTKTASQASPSPAINRSTAMIGPSIEVKGTVTGDEDLVIQGKVEGSVELSAHQVTVGESGKVNADITARTVRVDGEVAGDIRGNEKVVISKSGNVRGNIVAPRVTLEDGAIFKGSIDMDPGEVPAKVSLAPKTSTSLSEKAPELDLKSG
jgi:cytoskeletal protein CcmA (bactofilin family)